MSDYTEIASKIAAIGPNFNPEVLEATRQLYSPLVEKQSRSGITITNDIAYGSDERQKLDLYQPAGSQHPVLVYIPGGGFVGGDKRMSEAFYANLGIYFANHAILTVVANYRLAPAHPWPAGAQDVGSALAWARANAASHGGDPNRVIVFGQSAGSTHVATYLFDDSFHPKDGGGVKAAILMSGVYRIAGSNIAPNLKAYYGSDAGTYEARSPITHVNKSKVPLLISAAQYDPAFLAAPSFELARLVTLRDGRSPHFVWQQGHNHVSTVMSLGSGQDDVGARIRSYLSAF